MTITLWEKDIPYAQEGEKTPNSMTFYPTKTWYPTPTVVVLPGGGYKIRAEHEGESIAKFYQSRGFQAFVVNYRCMPNRFPSALSDAQQAIKIIRRRADEFHVDPNAIFVIGFSAGGHLAGCLATMDDVCPKDDEVYASISPKPTGAILSYPVISTETLDGSPANQCVLSLIEGLSIPQEKLSLEKIVSENTSPCFLWHTVADTTVSVTHSLRFCEALRHKNVPFELHVYPDGPHGLGLAQMYPEVATWCEHSVDWILRMSRPTRQ